MSPSTDALARHLLASCPGLWDMVSNLWRENESSRAGKRPAVWIRGALGGGAGWHLGTRQWRGGWRGARRGIPGAKAAVSEKHGVHLAEEPNGATTFYSLKRIDLAFRNGQFVLRSQSQIHGENPSRY